MLTEEGLDLGLEDSAAVQGARIEVGLICAAKPVIDLEEVGEEQGPHS